MMYHQGLLRNSLALTSDQPLHSMMQGCSSRSRRLSLPTDIGIGRRSSFASSNPLLPVQFRLVQRRMRRFSLPTEKDLVNDEAVIYVDPTQKVNKRLRRRQANPTKQGSRRWETSCRSDSASRESNSMVSRSESVDSASRGSDTSDSLVDAGGESISFDEPDLVHVNNGTLIEQLPPKCGKADFQAKTSSVLANAPPKRPRRTKSNGSNTSEGIPLEVVIVSPGSVVQAIPLRCDHPSLPVCSACHRQAPATNCPPKMPRRSSVCSNSSQIDGDTNGEMNNSASQLGNSSSSISRTSQFSKAEMSVLVADYWNEKNDTDKEGADLNVTSRPQKHDSSNAAANYWEWNETSMDEDIIMEMARYSTQSESCSKRGVAASSKPLDKSSTTRQQMANYWDEDASSDIIPNVQKKAIISAKKTGHRRSVASRVVANYWDWVVSETSPMDEDVVSEAPSSSRSRQSSIKTRSSISKGDVEFAASSQERRDQLLYGY